jgi:hypothetical protein
MSLIGAGFSLLRGRKVPATAAGETLPQQREGEFVTREAEMAAELSEAEPLNPATGVPEPLEIADGDDSLRSR